MADWPFSFVSSKNHDIGCSVLSLFDRVYIEISNICNLQCDFCPEVERTKKIMSLDLFTKIIDELVGLTREVAFHLMGEPLAHPQLPFFLNHCQKVGMPVNLTTNGTLINVGSRQDAILNSSVRQINFSLQSYAANYPDRSLDQYLSHLVDFSLRAEVERPDMYINFRLWNKGSKEDTLLDNRNYLDFIENAFASKISNKVDVGFRKSMHLRNRIYIHFDSRFEWPKLDQPIRSQKGFCYGLRNHFGIHADGTVVPCCLDKEAVLNLGKVDANKESALSVLNALKSERARKIRDGFSQFRLTEELCQRCDFIKRFDKKVIGARTKIEIDPSP